MAAEVIAFGHVAAVDGLEVAMADRPQRPLVVVNFCGLGIMATSLVTAEKMRWLGPLKYDVAGALNIVSGKGISALKLSADVGEEKGTDLPWETTCTGMALCMGQASGSEMKFAPLYELDNGCVDIVVLPVVSTVAMAQIMLSLAPGKHVLDERIKTYRATRLSAEAAEPGASLPVNIDGDVLGHLPATFTVRRGAFEVFRPDDFVEKHERRYCFG